MCVGYVPSLASIAAPGIYIFECNRDSLRTDAGTVAILYHIGWHPSSWCTFVFERHSDPSLGRTCKGAPQARTDILVSDLVAVRLNLNHCIGNASLAELFQTRVSTACKRLEIHLSGCLLQDKKQGVSDTETPWHRHHIVGSGVDGGVSKSHTLVIGHQQE